MWGTAPTAKDWFAERPKHKCGERQKGRGLQDCVFSRVLKPGLTGSNKKKDNGSQRPAAAKKARNGKKGEGGPSPWGGCDGKPIVRKPTGGRAETATKPSEGQWASGEQGFRWLNERRGSLRGGNLESAGFSGGKTLEHGGTTFSLGSVEEMFGE